MSLRPVRSLSGALLLACLLGGAVSVRAQTSAHDTLPPLPLDTLTVRVLHTPIPLLRAPYAVSAVGEEEIRRAKPGLSLDEALEGVPGVQVDNRYNYALGERISVRGFGARAQFGVRGVRVLLDGIPATFPDGQTTLNHVDPGSLGRAEVVRGPAGALYGNAAGGVIRLTSAPPPPVPLGSEHRLVAGGNGLLRLQSSVGGQAVVFWYRAGATRLNYGGYREHIRARNTLANAQLGWRGARGEVRFAAHAVRYDALNPGSLSDSLLRVDRSRAFPRNVAQRTGEEGEHGQAGVVWEHRLGAGLLEASGYFLGRALDNPIPNVIIDLRRRAGGGRLALSSAAGGARWTAGVQVDAQRDDRENHANRGGERGALTLSQRERVTSAAGFAQGAAPLGSRVELLGAVRYDRFRFAADDRLVTPTNPDDSGARTMDAWSPTLGLSARVAAGATLYANLATAFETPTTTELANRPSGAGGFNPELEPQRTLSLEAGSRGRLGGWGSYEISAYRAAVRDALIPFEVEGAPGRVFYRNAGSALHRGVEAGLLFAPGRGVSGRVAYTWTDARFREYAANGETLAGNRVPGIAPRRLEGRLAWESAAGPFVETTALHSSATPVDDRNRFRSPAYTVADLRAGWEGAGPGRLRATPFVGVNNLFDRAYNTSVVVNAFGGRYFEPGPGRTLYLGVEAALGPR